MLAQETQGQHICKKVITNDNCEGPVCTALCDKTWQGTGQCVKTYDKRFICLCNFDCRA